MPKVTIQVERCKGCGLCVPVCPKKVLALSEANINKKGYNPAEAVHPDACIGCALCATICPDVAIIVEK